jgi:hypothetical protein
VPRDYLRVSLEDAHRRQAEGWTFASGWYPFALTWWAWFTREAADG